MVFERDKYILGLAFPLILANITTPILGLVDTAILGHMGATHYLAGASIAALIITQVYWICGFVKMSITGVSAQSDVLDQASRLTKLSSACIVSAVISLFILLSQTWILELGLRFLDGSEQAVQSASHYFSVRVWGAPAALLNLVFVGWLIGQHQTRQVLFLQILVNVVNIIASLFFVYVLDWQVRGVAAGTLVAEYVGLLFGAYLCLRAFPLLSFQRLGINLKELRSIISLNSDIFLRNLALQFTLGFVSLVGASFGVKAAAINAILMQFFALIALGLDGIANAIEACVGRAKGRQDLKALQQDVNIGLKWSSVFAIIYAGAFYGFGNEIALLLTDQKPLENALQDYMLFIVLLPLIAHWCFLFDGVYVGLSGGKTMRNTMLLSTLLGFLPVVYFSADTLQNKALWLALLSFLLCRGAFLAAHYYYHLKRSSLLTLSRD